MKKTLNKNTMYKYNLSKDLKYHIKKDKIGFFAIQIDKKDFDILKNIKFDNCYVYTIKEYYYSLKKEKIGYYINLINKRIYKDYYSYNKDFGKLLNSYYFYKLKDFNKEKKYFEYQNFYIDYTLNNKFYKEYFNK